MESATGCRYCVLGTVPHTQSQRRTLNTCCSQMIRSILAQQRRGLSSKCIARVTSVAAMSSNASNNNTVRSTAASGSQIYESKRAVDEYLFFHYGDDNDKALQMPYSFGPKDALDFPARCARICNDAARRGGSGPTRALDIGCSVGGASFELARTFDEVVGVRYFVLCDMRRSVIGPFVYLFQVDFSNHFVDAAKAMQSTDQQPYTIMKQGFIQLNCVAKGPAGVDKSRVRFEQGDACNLAPHLGMEILAGILVIFVLMPPIFRRSV
jgi:SAM-dependent methyltransferase